MPVIINDFVVNIATVNGSGSKSANTILLKTLFRMGIPVSGKNVFPANIAGLPSWFWIRASTEGYTGHKKIPDIIVGMNPQTLITDQKLLKTGGVFLYNSDLRVVGFEPRKDTLTIGIPFKQLVDQATTLPKIKKLLANIIYVGALAELLKLDSESLDITLKDQFSEKISVYDVNKKAMDLGREYIKANLAQVQFPFRAQKANSTSDKMLLDGNTASALGLIYGGATFAAWYPITPATSLVENFVKYSEKVRKTLEGKNKFSVIQAEDELSSISMVLGAGWAGARAFTATSGPGLSLMQEAVGLAYYAEIPSVIWNVQRVGPSTGMPTRTAQGDLLAAVYASHGDTKHPVLFPGNVAELFEFGQTCFDLAERLQQLIFVLSDLDLGMNLWITEKFKFPEKPFDRGKVLTAEQLSKISDYDRYADPDGDGISYRSLPGTQHPKSAYLTRGAGHSTKAQYTERSDEYLAVVDRLAKKWDLAKTLVPKPIIENNGLRIGIIAYGSTDAVIKEGRDILNSQGIQTDYLRIRAVPFTEEVSEFIKSHDLNYVVDLNRDAQMLHLLRTEIVNDGFKFFSILHYDGTPITAEAISEPILANERKFK